MFNISRKMSIKTKMNHFYVTIKIATLKTQKIPKSEEDVEQWKISDTTGWNIN